jgi:signal transduction histidine kinase
MPESILLVDDNEINRRLVSYILSADYGAVQEAADGHQCLEALANQNFDLVLLDLNMPNKSGFEVLEELQLVSSPRSPVVIVLSADNDPETISRSFQLGAADYLTTPFNRDELLARVKTHLALHNREQYLEERVQKRTAALMETNQRLKEATSQLIQAEKMASLGQLAAGVAHEINNPVGYINSNLDTLRAYTKDLLEMIEAYRKFEMSPNDASMGETLRELRKKIDLDFLQKDIHHLIVESLQGVNHVKQIVSDLKGFSHPEEKEWQKVDLNEVIDSSLNIVNNELKYKAEVIKHYGELPPLQCITPQIKQVLVNLLVNAGQAIDERGSITIETGCDEDKQNIYIHIQDTGQGIDDDTLQKIFDPFFTTKPVGQGTGLGLSVSYGIIQSHRGTISVASEKGKGSRFTIKLPVNQSATA